MTSRLNHIHEPWDCLGTSFQSVDFESLENMPICVSTVIKHCV